MLPLCDTSLSGIREDKCMPYYSEVDKWSNIYAYQVGIGGSCNHGFKTVKLYRFFRDGFIVMYGVRGGTIGVIYCHLQMCSYYGDYIVNGGNHWHWIQIKMVKRICNNDTATKKYSTVKTRDKN